MACRRSTCRNYYPKAEELCDPCEEFETQKNREEFGIVCLHCGRLFFPAGSFDQHKMQVYYREHQPFPRGRRVKI